MQICRMKTTTEIEFFCSDVLLKTCVNIYLRRCLLFPQSSIKNVIKYFVQFPAEKEGFFLKLCLKIKWDFNKKIVCYSDRGQTIKHRVSLKRNKKKFNYITVDARSKPRKSITTTN